MVLGTAYCVGGVSSGTGSGDGGIGFSGSLGSGCAGGKTASLLSRGFTNCFLIAGQSFQVHTSVAQHPQIAAITIIVAACHAAASVCVGKWKFQPDICTAA